YPHLDVSEVHEDSVFLPWVVGEHGQLRPERASGHVQRRHDRVGDVGRIQLVRIVSPGPSTEVRLHLRGTHADDTNAVWPELGLPDLAEAASAPLPPAV